MLHILSPEFVGAIDPPIERILGAAVLVLALGAGLAYRAGEWGEARLAVLLQFIWMCLYAVGMAWGILSGGITPAALPPTILAVLFAILLLVFYLREQKKQD